MVGSRDASSSSSGLLRSQCALDGFELLWSSGTTEAELLDFRDVFVSRVCWARSLIVAESAIRPVVSWCLELGEGRLVVVIVRDPRLDILSSNYSGENGGVQSNTQTLRWELGVTTSQGCWLPRLQTMMPDERMGAQDGVLV